MRKINLSEELQHEIANKYISGISVYQMIKDYGLSDTVLNRVLKEQGITKRDDSHKHRKYTINENYFDVIDTPNKAYILGLLYSDGCNFARQNRVVLALQERDKDILEKICLELNYSRPLSIRHLNDKNDKWQNSYELIIVNKHISEQLAKLGVIPNKSLVLSFPYWMEPHLLPHFLRGMVDGDGHIEVGNSVFLTIASSKKFCDALYDYVKMKYLYISNISPTYNPKSECKIWSLSGKNNVYAFLKDLYETAELCIERKYMTYLRLKERILSCS